MSKMTYTIVKHDGGWAYNANGTFSERFDTHDAARHAALRAAREQAVPGDPALITWEDSNGNWHKEFAASDDRPEISVKG